MRYRKKVASGATKIYEENLSLFNSFQKHRHMESEVANRVGRVENYLYNTTQKNCNFSFTTYNYTCSLSYLSYLPYLCIYTIHVNILPKLIFTRYTNHPLELPRTLSLLEVDNHFFMSGLMIENIIQGGYNENCICK